VGALTVRSLMLVFLACTTGAQADAAINRCTGADGGLIYTDRSCAAIGSEARLPVTEVVPRFAPPALGFGCAANSPEAMRSAVHLALQERDANALAGLYNFDGRSARSAAPIMRRLQNLSRRSAVAIDLEHTSTDSILGWAMPAPDELPRLRISHHAAGREGALHIDSFRLHRAAGCIWLSG